MSRLLSFLLGACAVTGVTFWFIVGFPFEHHNESYVIASQLHSMDFWSATFGRVFPVANLRPAGQGLMWLAMSIPAGLALLQIFNILCTIAAFVLALRAVRARATLSYALCVTGAALFSGYIFLFHLHGVFYGPMLILCSALLGATPAPLDGATVRRMGVLTLVVLLFHPYAILLFGAWVLAGLVAGTLTLRTVFTRDLPMHLAVVAVAAVVLLLPPREAPQSPAAMLIGGLVSYQVVEVHPLVTAFIGILVVVTIATMWRGARPGVKIALVLGSLGLYLLALPAVLIWIAVNFVKALRTRRWTPAFLLAVATMFPFPTATGSPTYGIFAILIATIVMVDGLEWLEEGARAWHPRIAGTVVALALVSLILIRSDVGIPGVEALARPLHAEREKTAQLQQILDWNTSPGGPRGTLTLGRESLNPTAAMDILDRRFRPPTSQPILDRYVRSYLTPGTPASERILIVTFGGDSIPGQVPVMSFPGLHAGPALVYSR
ncbi:hypothetical protein ANRL2_00935 [Anaerolineae bacterium]|nr:hypothetical protein ANRL2_00935 [Anaerolineae bacterium]